MDDFELISTETYANLAGIPFDVARKQFENHPVVVNVTADILNDWTDPNHRDPPNFESDNGTAELIAHPKKHEFDETDAKRIATVWTLGLSAVELSKHALAANPEFHRHRSYKRPLFGYYWMFSSNGWHQLNPDAPESQPGYRSQSTDVLDIANIRKWPNGGFINCLGVSIAMAGAVELDNRKYVYSNELRQSQASINENHGFLMKRLEAAWPGFINDPIVRESFSVIDRHYPKETDEYYQDILFTTPGIMSEKSLPRDFHHSVRVEHSSDYQKPEAKRPTKKKKDTDKKDSDTLDVGKWLQLDPYSLTYRDTLESAPVFMSNAVLSRPGNYADIVLHDTSRSVETSYRQNVQLLDICMRFRNTAVARFDTDTRYKSSNWPDKVYDGGMKFVVDAHKQVLGAEFDELAEKNLSGIYAVMFFGVLSGIAEQFGLSDERVRQAQAGLIDRFAENPDKYAARAQKHFFALERHIIERSQQDTSLRRQLFESVKGLPILCTAYLYRATLRNYFRVRDTGFQDTAAELSNPYFMIGAMYMNHYATWRKDGRINVARHLARFSASQLLWQAALQDGEETDERVKALGETIRGLDQSQTHPLVNIARGIYY